MAVHSTTAIGDRSVSQDASALRIRCGCPRGKWSPQIGCRNVCPVPGRIDGRHPDEVRGRRVLGVDRCRPVGALTTDSSPDTGARRRCHPRPEDGHPIVVRRTGPHRLRVSVPRRRCSASPQPQLLHAGSSARIGPRSSNRSSYPPSQPIAFTSMIGSPLPLWNSWIRPTSRSYCVSAVKPRTSVPFAVVLPVSSVKSSRQVSYGSPSRRVNRKPPPTFRASRSTSG